MIIRKVFYKIKKFHKQKQFNRNSVFGEFFNCTDTSSCCNKSGNRQRIKIGDNCEICGHLTVDESGKIVIGDFSTIRYNTSIESTNEIIIGDHVIISNNVIIRDNNTHPTDPEIRIKMCESGFSSDMWKQNHSRSAAIHIESNVWVGERAIIYKGVTIGKGSIVAGGSVVTKPVPEYCVVAGNPARVVKSLK